MPNIQFLGRPGTSRDFGDDVYVVGRGDLLGEWTPKQGVLLRTHEEAYPATRPGSHPSTCVPKKIAYTCIHRYIEIHLDTCIDR